MGSLFSLLAGASPSTFTTADKNSKSSRVFMLAVTGPVIGDTRILNIDNGGWCIGAIPDPSSPDNQLIRLSIVPCLIDDNGKAATKTSANIHINPAGLWKARDEDILAGRIFSLDTFNSGFQMAYLYSMLQTPAGQMKGVANPFGVPFAMKYNEETGGLLNPNGNFPFLFSASKGSVPSTYENLIPTILPDFHLGVQNVGSNDPSLMRPVLTSMSGYRLDNNCNFIKIISIPYMSQCTNRLSDSSASCPYQNSAEPTTANSRNLFCCSGSCTRDSKNGMVFCSNAMTFRHFQILLSQPSIRIQDMEYICKVAAMGTFGPQCGWSCPGGGGGDSINCGCPRGLVPYKDAQTGSTACRRLQPADCPGMGVDLTTGFCACPVGTYGPNCKTPTVQPEPVWKKPWFWGLGIGIAALVGFLYLYSTSSSNSKSDDED